MRRAWALAILAALPLAAGIAARLPLTLWTANPVLYLRGSVATVVELGAGMVSVLLLLVVWLVERGRQAVARARAEMAEDRHRFMRRLDHELKNPLAVVQTALGNLAGQPMTAAQQEAVDSMWPPVRRLARLTIGLRKLGELEEQPLERSPVNVAQLLEEALEQVRSQPQGAGRQINLSVRQAPWPLPEISGDHELLLLCIYNLLDNACKFSRPGDKIEVYAAALKDESAVEVEVGDTGVGIPAEDLPHLGEELYRARSALAAPGSGLGLALVRVIVAQHGGRLTFQSRDTGGTLVTVRLPVKAPAGRRGRMPPLT